MRLRTWMSECSATCGHRDLSQIKLRQKLKVITSTLANCLSEIFHCTVEDHNHNRYEVFDLLNSGNTELLSKQATYDDETKEVSVDGAVLYRLV